LLLCYFAEAVFSNAKRHQALGTPVPLLTTTSEVGVPAMGAPTLPQTQSERAHELLEQLFRAGARVLCQDALKAGRSQAIAPRTMQRAAEALGVRTIRNGRHPAIWELRRQGGKAAQ
jgi:hypothetical protein